MISDHDYVCNCALKTVKDVKDMINEYPDMPKDNIKNVLNIGMGCGCCNHSECPTVVINFDELMKTLET